MRALQRHLLASRRFWAVVGIAFFVYGATVVAGGHTRSSGNTVFDSLAASFLHGRLDVDATAGSHDLTRIGDRLFVPFPPLPALLLLPWVAATGPRGVNTVWFGIVWGSLAVGWMHLFLTTLARRGDIHLDARGIAWITTLFGAGTVFWSVTILGSVWYLGQVTTVAMLTLAAWLAARRSPPWITGLALGMAILGRPNVALAAPFLIALTMEVGSATPVRRAALPLLATASALGALLLVYNLARFGSPFDFGYRTAQVAPALAADLARYGQFHLRYLGRNLEAMCLLLPRWDAGRHTLSPDPAGMSLLLTTPAVLWLWRARASKGSPSWSRGAWISIAALLVPLLTYYNTGWVQFGYRFSLDFTVPLVALIALGAGPRVSLPLKIAIVASVLVNGWGAAWWLGKLHGP